MINSEPNLRYPKEEKLKQKKDITLLFEKGKWRSQGKIRLIFYKFPESTEENIVALNKVGVSVSKRFFKKAVDRNRIKRLLREVYRHNKAEFAAKFGDSTLAMIFWNSPELPNHVSEVETEFLQICTQKKK